MSGVTYNLSQIESGDPSAAEQLLPLVYDELRKLAAVKLALEKPGLTMQATALVYEAFLRLAPSPGGQTDQSALHNRIDKPWYANRLTAYLRWMHFVILTTAFLTSNGSTAVAEIPSKQFFTQHCEKCHSGEKPRGDIAVANLTDDFNDKQIREQWLSVLEQLKEGNMPPKDERRPPAKDVQSVIDWIGTQAEKTEIARRKAEGRVVMRRLNRAEYANTVRDLLGVEVDLADLLPLDTSTNGFDNNAELLHTSSFLMRNYLDAADRVLDEAIANKPEPWILKKRFDIREEKSVAAKGSVYRHTDDGVAIFATWESAEKKRGHSTFLEVSLLCSLS